MNSQDFWQMAFLIHFFRTGDVVLSTRKADEALEEYRNRETYLGD